MNLSTRTGKKLYSIAFFTITIIFYPNFLGYDGFSDILNVPIAFEVYLFIIGALPFIALGFMSYFAVINDSSYSMRRFNLWFYLLIPIWHDPFITFLAKVYYILIFLSLVTIRDEALSMTFINGNNTKICLLYFVLFVISIGITVYLKRALSLFFNCKSLKVGNS